MTMDHKFSKAVKWEHFCDLLNRITQEGSAWVKTMLY